MIKKCSFRRIIISSISLVLVLIIINIFPKNDVKIESETNYTNFRESSIYLVDKNNYVAKTSIITNSKEKTKLAKELVEALINGTNKNKYLPDGFSSFIPYETVLEDVKIEDDLISLYFNDEFIKNSLDKEEKMIESLVYTLTEIEGIKGVKIYINNEILDRLPNSNIKLNNILTRQIGINRKSRINNYKNTKNVTAYFLSGDDENKYYVPVTFTTNSEDEKLEIIIKELKSSENIDMNLKTYLNASVEVKKYEVLENEVNVEFENDIFNQFHKVDEEITYGLTLSIKDTYNVENVNLSFN